MLKAVVMFGLAAGATGLVSAAEIMPQKMSDEALAALDPTRGGRLACRGLDTSGAVLNERLKLAQEQADRMGMGRSPMVLYSGIGRSSLAVGGLDGQARAYFDQGIALTFGFNHAAAIRSFRMAQQLAPDCAMCRWGEAMANGPNINAGMDDAQNQAALAALEKAQGLMGGASPEEQALIEAQVLRYSADPDADRAALDAAYAERMMALAGQFADNDDILVLAAESVMNTTPWNYWTEDKQPNGRIGAAVALIERVLARNPVHPQAAHLYIHLMENGPDPKTAEQAADDLARSRHDAIGHLVHMPGHIYYRIGRYADSMKVNVDAARADEAYLKEVGDDGLYRFGYYPHNVHFLLTSAQMIGSSQTVVEETARLSGILNADIARQLPWVQAIHAAPYFAYAQFASPSTILALSNAPSDLAYVDAMRLYARAIAHAMDGNEDGFATAIAALDAHAQSDEIIAMVETGFPAADLLRLAASVARGRAAYQRGDYAEAVALYEQAEAIETTIPYNEPPFWYYPVAQSRGAALFAAGDHEGARAAFRKALFQAPNSGWALFGLMKAEAQMGHDVEAQAAEAALERNWLGNRDWLSMGRL